jgi:hypothetical protein
MPQRQAPATLAALGSPGIGGEVAGVDLGRVISAPQAGELSKEEEGLDPTKSGYTLGLTGYTGGGRIELLFYLKY